MIHAINVLVIATLVVTSVVVEPAQVATALLARQQSGAWQYPPADGLGSLRHWTDASSQVTYAARYAPFGTLLWQQGTAPGPWGFAGEFQDPAGLLYLWARWYDPATGRFLTRDPFPGL
ncbi:MAG: RHS repeat-associated core domain-containing protein, partial [Anaerolineae bacterium]